MRDLWIKHLDPRTSEYGYQDPLLGSPATLLLCVEPSHEREVDGSPLQQLQVTRIPDVRNTPCHHLPNPSCAVKAERQGDFLEVR